MIGKIMSSIVSNTTKLVINLEYVIDQNISKFNDGCPIESELRELLTQKLKLNDSVNLIQNNIKTFNSTTTSVESLVRGLKTVVTVIKSIPAPVSVPPGAGIPLSIITNLSDQLSTVKIKLDQNEGLIQVGSETLSILNNQLNSVKTKLSSLEQKIVACLLPVIAKMSDQERQQFIEENKIELDVLNLLRGISVRFANTGKERTTGNKSSDTIYKVPPSIDEVSYRGYKFKIETNNIYTVPQRRIIAYNVIDKQQQIIGEWSFSTNFEPLINEIIYLIDMSMSPLFKPEPKER